MSTSHKRPYLAALLAAALALSSVADVAFARGGGGGGGFSGGGRSFSAPSFSRPSTPSPSFFKSTPAPTPAPAPTAPTRAVVAPAPTPTAPNQAPAFRTAEAQKAQAPATKSFDAKGAEALKQAESRNKFMAAQAATSPSAQSKAATEPAANTSNYRYNRDEHVADLRSQLSREKWQNRQMRQDQQFGQYAGRPPIFSQPAYHDPFGNMFFWMWLMEQNKHQSDQWIYNHQAQIDPSRMSELRQRDQDLDNRLRAIEAQGVKRDHSYTPPELKGNSDLVYGNDVVADAAKAEHSSSSFWLYLGLIILLGAAAYYFFFHFRGWARLFGKEQQHV